MGSVFKPKKPKGPSAEQLRMQREQAALAKKQREQLELQKEKLAEDKRNAAIEADRARTARISDMKRLRSRAAGRKSLIASGSELGTSQQLG